MNFEEQFQYLQDKTHINENVIGCYLSNYGDKYICHSYVIIFRNHFRISKANTCVMFDLLYHLYL